ncbi:hypothetical protein, partial [Enterobacter intestinihominis]
YIHPTGLVGRFFCLFLNGFWFFSMFGVMVFFVVIAASGFFLCSFFGRHANLLGSPLNPGKF